MGMGGQEHRERVQTCTSRLVCREGVGSGNEGWRGHLGLWEIPHSPERDKLAHRSEFRDSLVVILARLNWF